MQLLKLCKLADRNIASIDILVPANIIVDRSIYKEPNRVFAAQSD
jgi:hypothetical protein